MNKSLLVQNIEKERTKFIDYVESLRTLPIAMNTADANDQVRQACWRDPQTLPAQTARLTCPLFAASHCVHCGLYRRFFNGKLRLNTSRLFAAL
jgi:hypothetical protein